MNGLATVQKYKELCTFTHVELLQINRVLKITGTEKYWREYDY